MLLHTDDDDDDVKKPPKQSKFSLPQLSPSDWHTAIDDTVSYSPVAVKSTAVAILNSSLLARSFNMVSLWLNSLSLNLFERCSHLLSWLTIYLQTVINWSTIIGAHLSYLRFGSFSGMSFFTFDIKNLVIRKSVFEFLAWVSFLFFVGNIRSRKSVEWPLSLCVYLNWLGRALPTKASRLCALPQLQKHSKWKRSAQQIFTANLIIKTGGCN